MANALKNREERYRSLTDDVFDNLNSGLLILNADFKVAWINRAVENFFGFQRDQVIGIDKRELIHTQMSSIFADPQEFMDKVISSYDTNTYVERFECHVLASQTREDRWLEYRSLPVESGLYAGGRMEYYIDITPHKAAEEVLRESEKRYRTFFEQSIDAILIIEGDKFIDCNQATVEMLGYPDKEELLNRHPSELSPRYQPDGRESAEKANEMMSRAFEKGSHRFEWEHKQKDGNTFSVEVLLKTVSQEGKDNLYVIWRDITERKRTEESLSLRNRAIAEATNGIVITAYQPHNCPLLYANPAFLHITGYSLEEMIGRDLRFLHRQEHFQPGVVELRNAIERKEPCSVIIRNFKKDGSVFFNEISISPVCNLMGEITHYIGIMKDITERKLQEEQRSKLLKILEFKNKELNDIVYTASHDLRSPLVNIEGFSSELALDCRQLVELISDQSAGRDKIQQIEPILKESIPQELKFINAGAKKMSSLLDGLLQISRIGTYQIKTESLDMEMVVKGVFESFEHQIKKNNIVVKVDPLPKCIGDAHMLDHVFTNLISNAIKYRDPAKESTIKISGTVEGDRSIYCVEDNGIGIAPECQKKAFEIFHRLNPKGTVEGEGLGLTIVARIMNRLEGEVWLESEPGKGSKFFITLPADR